MILSYQVSNHYRFLGKNMNSKRNFSSKRNAIYNAVCSTDTHPSARWVYEKLKPDYPDLSLGTVYRNISLFKEEGMVNVVCCVNGEERIDATTSMHPHFVCNKCGRVIDVKENSQTAADSNLLALKGFTVESKLVIYYGECPECGNSRRS